MSSVRLVDINVVVPGFGAAKIVCEWVKGTGSGHYTAGLMYEDGEGYLVWLEPGNHMYSKLASALTRCASCAKKIKV